MQRHLKALVEWVQGKGLHLRSPKWPRVEKEHLKEQPCCQYCLGTENLAVHHEIPFHIDASQELSDANLITLCEAPGLEHHLHIGHLDNWKNFNSNVRNDCIQHQKDLTKTTSIIK